ncbi:hypothetical protein PVL29_005729 [Vitis rotundifolia]|uniref:Uncharacterized protein n=1 Tax=Vitis rotundifolia TaxID=103349 RepID=A0AA39A374_VITRO|nr:hypothetical protein PVL29_005729 [Vitis rotundifolia]
MVKEAVDRVTDDYVKSAIDWMEVYKGIPATCNGNFYIFQLGGNCLLVSLILGLESLFMGGRSQWE